MVPRLLTLFGLLLSFQLASLAQLPEAAASRNAPDTCPVTKPSTQPFVPPLPYSARKDPRVFWYGTDELWTSLPATGTWLPFRKDAPPDARLLRTVSWWRQRSWDAESEARLIVTGKRLDSPAPPPIVFGVHGGWLEENPLVSVNLRFPTPGCWEITGRYEDQQLSFVLWVTP